MKHIVLALSDVKSLSLFENLLPEEFKVEKAVDGLIAVRKIKLIKPNLIMSEYDLPLVSGLTLLKWLRSTPSLHHIPFVFVSKKPFQAEAMDYGANDWLDLDSYNRESLINKIYVHIN